MGKTYMPANDAPSLNLATAFVTVGDRRMAMLMAKEFEANFSVSTSDVPVLGKMINGKKATGGEIGFKMVIYKCTEAFDSIIEEFKNTGVLPTFDIQVTSEDPATSCGRSTKIYTDCTLDGDVLLSAFNAEGGFIEQTINGFAQDFHSPEKYTDPSYM